MSPASPGSATKRQDSERAFQALRLAKVDKAALLEEYVAFYITRRGDALAGAEYALTEAWCAVRVCGPRTATP